MPSHYLNLYWFIVNWNLRNKLQWNFNQNTKRYIHKKASENIFWEMAAILSRGRLVDSLTKEDLLNGNLKWISKIRCKTSYQWTSARLQKLHLLMPLSYHSIALSHYYEIISYLMVLHFLNLHLNQIKIAYPSDIFIAPYPPNTKSWRMFIFQETSG